MPEGNFTGSGTSLPLASRSCSDQQSSMLTCTYPASFNPDETKKSAVSLISFSLTSQPKAFQSLKPMGGVCASATLGAAAGVGAAGLFAATSTPPPLAAEPPAASESETKKLIGQMR